MFEVLNLNLVNKQSIKKESGSNWSRSPIFKSNNWYRNIYDHCKKKNIATRFIGICALEIVFLIKKLYLGKTITDLFLLNVTFQIKNKIIFCFNFKILLFFHLDIKHFHFHFYELLKAADFKHTF